jgi:hypothetical protein
MTKIQEIARLTSLTKDANGQTKPSVTSITYKTVKELGTSAHVRDLALAAVYEYNEPLSVLEITAHINNTFWALTTATLTFATTSRLHVKAGDILMRQELLKNACFVQMAVPTMNKPAHMFFRKGIGIPFRKTAELVPGVITKGTRLSCWSSKGRIYKSIQPKGNCGTRLGTPRPNW